MVYLAANVQLQITLMSVKVSESEIIQRDTIIRLTFDFINYLIVKDCGFACMYERLHK